MLSGTLSVLNRSVNGTQLFPAAPKLAAIKYPAFRPIVSSLAAVRSMSFSMPVHYSLTKRLQAIESKSPIVKGVSTFLNTFGTQTVDIYVGPHRQQFRVHEKLLHTRIPSFYDAIEITANSDDAAFRDEDPGNFDALLSWLYTGNLPELNSPTIGQGLQSDRSTWIPHKLYALAHKLDIPELMGNVMAEWIKRDSTYEYYPHFNMIDEVYSTTPTGSAPRKYVAWVMYSITRQEYKNPLWPGKRMRKMMEKHPDLKADFSEYIEEEKAQVEEQDKRVQRVEEEEAARTLEWQAELRETGIDPRSCNEAFAG